jgi:hypothetical protein
MKDTYAWTFYQVVKDIQGRSGYELPHRVEAYVTILLANHIDKTDFLPKKTFGESFLNLCYKGWKDSQELGDTCLFMTGVFPNYHNSKGFDVEYFSRIGQASYQQVNDENSDNLFGTLSKNFNFIRDFISLVVNNRTITPIL